MNIDKLLEQLTVEEMASLTAGADMWNTVPVDRLGIPALKMTDGPNGARGSALLGAGSATAVCIPCGSALGATWDPQLIERVGQMLGEEARTKNCRILLAPTINLHRSPLAGRNFECYSEDPLLSGKIAAGFVRGVQARGVAATAKHFVANDAELQRYTMSSLVDERTLREIYLVPFEIAVREGGAMAVMTGYNRLNGVYCSEHEWLLGVLKREWGFDGIVMTDWFSAGDTIDSAAAGLDLQMPGPARFYGPALADAVEAGTVQRDALADMARRLLRVIDRVHAWEDPAEAVERSEDLAEHRALARRTASDAAVLLSNDGTLPLDLGEIRSIAAIGPGWASANLMGGGSAQLRPHYRIAPIEILRERIGDRAEILHQPGCSIERSTPTLTRLDATTPDGQPGIALDFFANLDFEGPVVARSRFDDANLLFAGPPHPEVGGTDFSMRARCTLDVETSGEHTFSLIQAGRARVLVDGEVVLDGVTNPPPQGKHFFGMGSEQVTATVVLEAGSRAEIVVEYSSRETFLLRGARLGYQPPVADDPLELAARAAAKAQIAVVIVGTNHEWESEGHDRASMDLPGDQNELIERVTAANPNTVVLVNSGAPVTMDWADRVKAVLQVWLGGQEIGAAIVELLLGEAEPAGRLPTTIPLRLEHNPSHGNFPGENGEVRYGEGVLVGYRWYDERQLPVRYCFGHGLSYSRFEIAAPRLSASELDGNGQIEVLVDVTNRGDRRGAEVVQCYVAPPDDSTLSRPPRELRAFAKVWLDPGETKTARLELGWRAFAHWDPTFVDRPQLLDKLAGMAAMLPGGVGNNGRTQPGWYVDAGTHRILIGRSTQDILHEGSIEVAAELGPFPPDRD